MERGIEVQTTTLCTDYRGLEFEIVSQNMMYILAKWTPPVSGEINLVMGNTK